MNEARVRELLEELVDQHCSHPNADPAECTECELLFDLCSEVIDD